MDNTTPETLRRAIPDNISPSASPPAANVDRIEDLRREVGTATPAEGPRTVESDEPFPDSHVPAPNELDQDAALALLPAAAPARSTGTLSPGRAR